MIYKNWIEVAIGVQNNWLDYQKLTKLWSINIINIPDKDRYADIYFAEQTSKEDIYYCFLNLLKKIIVLKYQLIITAYVLIII